LSPFQKSADETTATAASARSCRRGGDPNSSVRTHASVHQFCVRWVLTISAVSRAASRYGED